MNVEIGTEAAQFSVNILFQIFGIVSLQCIYIPTQIRLSY
jgi:hypothetical protein